MIKKAKVRKTMVVKYPEGALLDLKEFVKGHGAYISIKDETGIAYRTVQRIVKDGKAQLNTVMKLKDFISSVKSQNIA